MHVNGLVNMQPNSEIFKFQLKFISLCNIKFELANIMCITRFILKHIPRNYIM